jgi:hypothetical protein
VPGYDRTVPPGQKPSPIEGPRIRLALMRLNYPGPSVGKPSRLAQSKAGRLTYYGRENEFPTDTDTGTDNFLKERIHEPGCIVDHLGAKRSPIPGGGIQSLAIGKVSLLDDAQLLHHRRVIDQKVDLRV